MSFVADPKNEFKLLSKIFFNSPVEIGDEEISKTLLDSKEFPLEMISLIKPLMDPLSFQAQIISFSI